MALSKRTYSPGSLVFSDNLNDIQDEIIANAADIAENTSDLFAQRWIAFYNRVWLDNSAQDPYWTFANNWGAWTWDYAAAEAANPGTGPNLWIPISLRSGVIHEIDWKFFADHANGLANVVLHLWAFDINTSAPNSAPSGASASSKSLSSGFTAGQWDVASFSSNLPLTLDDETSYFMYVAGAGEVDGDWRCCAPLIKWAPSNP